MEPPIQYQLQSAQTRLDIWYALKEPSHPLNKAWPRFLKSNLTQKHFYDTLLERPGLRRYQFAATEPNPTGGETLIANGHSIPFFWPELEEARNTGGLPANPHFLQRLLDGGWDTIVSRGVRQYLGREALSSSSLPVLTTDQERDLMTCQVVHKPNALSALDIVVKEDRRRLGIAERLIEAMKLVAQEERLQILVVPVRPTRKADFPSVSMEDYVSRTHKVGEPKSPSTPILLQPTDSSRCQLPGYAAARHELPFDPWLRKHVLLRG
ncbi:MAG: hypothetical protein Q9164_002319 [Protoblastenia rupestris]